MFFCSTISLNSVLRLKSAWLHLRQLPLPNPNLKLRIFFLLPLYEFALLSVLLFFLRLITHFSLHRMDELIDVCTRSTYVQPVDETYQAVTKKRVVVVPR